MGRLTQAEITRRYQMALRELLKEYREDYGEANYKRRLNAILDRIYLERDGVPR